MKAKRTSYQHKISSQSVILMIILFVGAILSITLGSIYTVPGRFTLPIAILALWFGGAMALWHFGKRRF